MNSKNKSAEIQAYYKRVMAQRPEEEKIESDSLALMACFLSRIEWVLEEKATSKKALAKEINVSPSYLSQVFRGDKPLNFITLAKIQRALGIQFEITLTAAPRPKLIRQKLSKPKAMMRKPKRVLVSH